jgi:serine/threonine protein kinase
MDPRTGRILGGRYRVVERIGVGSLGTVYRCDDLSTDRGVALKVFRRELSRDGEFVELVRRQAEVAATFRETQSGLLSVHGFGQTGDGRAFLVTEHLRGISLSAIVRRRGPLELRRALRLACQIAEALDGIHARGFVHTDVRPQHVIVSNAGQEESVTLKGFEVALARESSLVGHLLRAGVLSGHPEYAPPEQIEGDRVTVRTDVYAFGVMLYEMLSGRVPFSASSPDGVLAKHLQDSPVPLSAIRRGIPSVVELRVRQALEKEPERRQRYVGDVANAYLCELAAEELEAAEARRKSGVVRRIAMAVQSHLPTRREPPSGRPPLSVGWKIAALVALLALLSLPAFWLVSAYREAGTTSPQALRRWLDAPRPAAVEMPGPRVDGAPEPPALPGPAVAVSGDASAEPVSVGEAAEQRSAPEAGESERKRTDASVSPPPRESSLRPPGAPERRDPGPRPQERIERPAAGGRTAVPPLAAPPAPSGPSAASPPGREALDPSAIIDWLLGQPSRRD